MGFCPLTRQLIPMELQVPFKTILIELVESTSGSSGAILADWEGEAVEQYSLYDPYEMKVIGAHKGIILSQMKEIHARFPAGDLQEAILTTASQHVIFGPVGPEYSLVMTLDRKAMVGKGLHCFRKSVKRLVKEIY